MIPVVTAAIVAAVLSPVVRFLAAPQACRAAPGRRSCSPSVLAAGAGLNTFLIIAGITSQLERAREGLLKSAAAKLQSTLQDAGVSARDAAKAVHHDSASSSLSGAFHALLEWPRYGRQGARLAGDLSVLHRPEPVLPAQGRAAIGRAWLQGHIGLPQAVGQTVGERTLQALRGYFAGVAAVAAFNAIVIGLGALVLGVPLAPARSRS